jgi:hypothetical protein
MPARLNPRGLGRERKGPDLMRYSLVHLELLSVTWSYNNIQYANPEVESGLDRQRIQGEGLKGGFVSHSITNRHPVDQGLWVYDMND